MPGGRYSVNTHARADRVVVDGDPQRYYLDTLRSLPAVARRLEGARQVNKVVGLKRIGNGYRQAAGPGWALVGDALHYKDPVDGQGIYDALLEARCLATALCAWRDGLGWEPAMAGYTKAALDGTRPMYQATINRLKTELYEEPPVPVIRTLIRWMMTDPLYQERFFRFLGRDLAPQGWMTPTLMAGAVARGLTRDLRGLWSSRRAA